MQRHRRWRAAGASLVLTTAAGVAAVGTSTPLAGAVTPPALAVTNIPAGDVLAGGAGDYFRVANVTATGTATTEVQVSIPYTGSNGTGNYTVTFAPKTAGTLTAPQYEAVTAPLASATAAKLTVAQGVAVCNDTNGEFTINDIAFGGGGGQISRLAMTWKLACKALPNSPLSSGTIYLGQTNGPLGSPAKGEYFGMAPQRLLDTRTTSALGPAGTVNIPVAGAAGVPANAIAAVVNITAIAPSAATFLTAYPAGGTRPEASNVNPVPGDIVPNLATVKIGAGGAITLYNEAGTTNAAVDVMGYFLPVDATTAGGRFVGQTPTRILDTRNSAPLTAGGTVDITVDAGATAAILNVTAVDASTGTFVTVFPKGAGVPGTSNLNVKPIQALPNLVVTQLTNGQATIYNDAGSVNVVVDVVGTFKEAGASATSGLFVPVDPARALDTRRTINGLAAAPITQAGKRDAGLVGLLGGYAFEYAGFVGNLTVTNTTGSSFLTAYPTGASQPPTSNLNWLAGETRPNLVMLATDDFGFNTFYNEIGQTDLVIDVAGWFTR